MSAAKTGRVIPPEQRAKISASMKGKANHKPTPAIGRVMAAIVENENGCWIYTGTLIKRGYGVIGEGRAKKYLVHRLVYEHNVGPIPDGLTLDHLCGATSCCNPAHLEPVTRAENTRRQWAQRPQDPGRKSREKTHCKRGHEFTEENTRHYNGRRHCRACERWRQTQRKAA